MSKRPLLHQGAALFFWQCLSKALTAAGAIWAARALGPQKLGVSAIARNVVVPLSLVVLLGADNLFVRRLTELEEGARREFMSLVFSFRLLFALALALAGLAAAFFLLPGPLPLCVVWGGAFLLVFLGNPPLWALTAQKMGWQNMRANAMAAVVALALYLCFRPGVPAGADLCVQAVSGGLAFFLGWRAACGGLPFPDWRRVRRIGPLLWEGRWLFLSSLVIYVYISLETALVGAFLSVKEAGTYQSAVQLSNFGAEFLALAPILLYPHFIEWHREGGGLLWRRQKQIASVLAPCIVGVSLGAWRIAPWLHRLVYGPAFAGGAPLFALLFSSKLVVLLNGIFAWGLWAQGRDKEAFLKLFLPTAILSLSGNLLLIPRYGAGAAAGMNLFSEIVVLAGAIALARRDAKS